MILLGGGGVHGKGGSHPPPSRARSLCPGTVSLAASASFSGIYNRQQPPPTALATSSNRLSDRCWGRLWGPFPSNASRGGGGVVKLPPSSSEILADPPTHPPTQPPTHPHQKIFPRETNMKFTQRGPNLEVDFRYTNFFLASDPPPPPPGTVLTSHSAKAWEDPQLRPAVQFAADAYAARMGRPGGTIPQPNGPMVHRRLNASWAHRIGAEPTVHKQTPAGREPRPTQPLTAGGERRMPVGAQQPPLGNVDYGWPTAS